MPALCCATEVSQGSWMGSSPRSDLPEDCHGAGKASGSVKSCIDQKVLRTGSAELAGLKGRGRYSGPGRCLPCWMCFGPSGGANFSTRKGTHPWAGRLFAWSHPRERREGPAERVPGGKSGHRANGTACLMPPCRPPPGPSTPDITAYPLGYACSGTPQKPQLPGNLSRALKQQPPPKGACSGKNKAPTLKVHAASQGAPVQYH